MAESTFNAFIMNAKLDLEKLLNGLGLEYETLTMLKLFQVLIKGYPNNLLESTFARESRHRRTMLELLFQKHAEYHGLCFELHPKYIYKILKEEKSSPKLYDKILFILFLKGFQSYLYYIDGQPQEGFISCRWYLQMISYLRKLKLNKLDIILSETERWFSILCAKCLIYAARMVGPKWFTYESLSSTLDEAGILQGLLYNILTCTEASQMRYENNFDRNLISQFFESIGDIEEGIAIFNGKLSIYTEIDDDNEEKNSACNFGTKPDKNAIEEMINKYVIAITFKIEGDPSILRCLEKIIQGLLLYGGIHMEALIFFLSLKEFYCKRVGNEENADAKESCYYGYDFFEECSSLVRTIIEDWQTLQVQYNIATIHLPQILLKSVNGTLILVDELKDQINTQNSCNAKLLKKWKAKSNWHHGFPKNITQLRDRCDDDECELGAYWINLWKSCTIEHNGEICSELLENLQKFESTLLQCRREKEDVRRDDINHI
ncbi:hypothetical protein KAFR_0H01790 [Kazachstania africana CBS 2517]|uniref:Uncharacterized protein n=1 Tax=Kazachstania africana (strain ATCC 22294 / BCRC 22015 / CBS 2517 / CECT 1963 / NBRC 1671 / NRRL Y-8276) TaxID=1071382 RepID=H2AZ33_KAZAF|nr:hypothetical protein KAFR_0H01790 [Kazachstania africana CBS 2517]CCF59589.1 hypothetical protein KAFR_0H01790 [Kazachstania africana CBS 2517]